MSFEPINPERCERKACQVPLTAATRAVHRETNRVYCIRCAAQINIACRDLKPDGLVFIDGRAPGIT